MTKTQFNFALPTDLLSFVASKNDNSASTDPNMPATKSPDFYYEGVKADNTTQSVSLYYDVSDSYAKKLVVDGVTTNLDLVNADDAVTNISLEGSTNPLTFLFQTMDENVGYIWDAVTETMVAIQVCGSTSCSPIIADASSFETIYTDITALPAPAPLTILFTTPNPLTGLGEVVKSFTLEMDVVGGYLNYTFVREDKSSFTMSLEDAAIPIVNNGITLTKMLTIIDSGVTIKYFGSANMTASLTQMSGYIADAVNGTFTTTEPQPIDLSENKIE